MDELDFVDVSQSYNSQEDYASVHSVDSSSQNQTFGIGQLTSDPTSLAGTLAGTRGTSPRYVGKLIESQGLGSGLPDAQTISFEDGAGLFLGSKGPGCFASSSALGSGVAHHQRTGSHGGSQVHYSNSPARSSSDHINRVSRGPVFGQHPAPGPVVPSMSSPRTINIDRSSFGEPGPAVTHPATYDPTMPSMGIGKVLSGKPGPGPPRNKKKLSRKEKKNSRRKDQAVKPTHPNW